MLLHHAEELDDDLGGGSQEDLSLAGLLSVNDRLKAVSQHTHAHHSKSYIPRVLALHVPYLLSISKDNNN